MRSKLLSNTLWLLIAQALVKGVAFVYSIYLAGALGVEQFGLYIAALAYFSLFSSITDFGFNRFLVREGAKDLQKLSQYLASIIILRIGMTAILFAGFSLLIFQLDNNRMRVMLSVLAVLAVLPQSLGLTLDSLLVAREKLKYSSIGLLLLSIANSLLGVYFISSGWGVTGALFSIILSQLIYIGVLIIFIQKAGISLRAGAQIKYFKEIAKGSLPYGILGVLGLVYFRIDSLMLSYLKGSYDAGIYGAAFRFLEAIVFVPSAVATALFPVLSRLHDNNLPELKRLYFKSLQIIGSLSVGTLIIFLVFLPSLIESYLPQYQPSIEVLRILSWTIPFMFLHVIGTIVLLSTDKLLKSVIVLSLFTVAFNIIANLYLIPEYSYIGAAYVTVASEALSFIVFFELLYWKILRHV